MKEKTELKFHKSRLWIVQGFLVSVVLMLLARAFYLQILSPDLLKKEGDARFLREVELPAHRGMITDRNGEVLAISTPVASLCVKPSELFVDDEAVDHLAALMRADAVSLRSRLSRYMDRECVFIERHLSPHRADEILAAGIPGVFTQKEYRRYYPAGDVVSHVVGITDIEDQGVEGLELAFDHMLKGEPGKKLVIKDRRGKIVEEVKVIKHAHEGGDLALSLDLRIQYLAYRELASTAKAHQARSASLVVLDAESSEVLAMVNWPSYNPNSRNKPVDGSMRNRAVTDLIEPGSVIKPVVMAAALESGRFVPGTRINTSPGRLEVANHIVRDARNYGVLDLEGVLVHSSNVGMTRIAMEMDAEHMWRNFLRFGFGESTGSGFPGEAAGVMPGYHSWHKVEQATLSYGYRLSVSCLQLAQAYAVIASGGYLRAPTFVANAINERESVIDPAITGSLTRMMEAVVDEEGTGRRADVNYFRVAGKTGTARKTGKGGYKDRYVASFAGFAPLRNPRLVVVVNINDPAGDAYYGGELAAPVFRKVMSDSLRILNIAPDDIHSSDLMARVSG